MTTPSPAPTDGEEHPQNTYPSFLPQNETEFIRLLLRHRLLSKLMEGILPSSLDLSNVTRILDVGCGAGGWVLDMARTYPTMRVIGIDKSEYFIKEARQMARLEKLNNATFLVRDMYSLEGEDFAPASFDLIHMRFLVGEITPQTYLSLLEALVRLCRPGGMLVWTEMELPVTSSPAYEQLNTMVVRALQKAGRAFSPAPGSSLGITAYMESGLRKAGCRIGQDSAYAFDLSAGTPFHHDFLHQAEAFGHQLRSFLLATGVTTAMEFGELLRRVRQEMQVETFCGLCYVRTVVGVRRREDDLPEEVRWR